MHYLIRYVPTGQSTVAEMATVASSAEEARVRGSRQGAVLSVRKSAAYGNASRMLDVNWWCKELSTLLRSGMTVVEALDVLCASAGEATRRSLLEHLRREVEAGLPLSRAMQAVGVFPPVLVATVSASERASTLQEALQDYLRHQVMIDRLKRRAVSAAIYPGRIQE
jgi:general secretion pathway protein F